MTDCLLDAATTLKKIRPWLHPAKSTHQKYDDMCDEMLKLECLSALFKCMSIGCCFYTSDVTLFKRHLALHLRYQASDFKNFSLCSYCTFNGDNLCELVDHIMDEHGSDKYQCLYCFYRSYELQVGTHQNLYHSIKKSSVIICHVTRIKAVSEELSSVWENLKVNVPGISCMGKKLIKKIGFFLLFFIYSQCANLSSTILIDFWHIWQCMMNFRRRNVSNAVEQFLLRQLLITCAVVMVLVTSNVVFVVLGRILMILI